MKRFLFILLLLTVFLVPAYLGYCIGFWQGCKYLPENTYRAEVSLDWMSKNPEKATDLFMLHAENCRLLAKYKPPIPDDQMEVAVSELMSVMQQLSDAEKALSELP